MIVAVMLALLVGVITAYIGISFSFTVSAKAAGSGWELTSIAASTVAPGETLRYVVDARNISGATTDSSDAVTITASLPPEMTAVSADVAFRGFHPCRAEGGGPVLGATRIVCTNSGGVAPDKVQVMRLAVMVDGNVPVGQMLTADFGVSSAALGTASAIDNTEIGPVPGYGIESFDGQVMGDAAGNPYTQAGGNPYAISTTINFNTRDNRDPLIDSPYPIEPAKDLFVSLPAGFVGNPTSVPECPLALLASATGSVAHPLCAPASQVGVTFIHFRNPQGISNYGPLPVFNIQPPPNVPARFGFNALGSIVVLDGQVRTGGDYGITVASHNIPEGIGVAGVTVTFWGVPADASHNNQRACSGEEPPFLSELTCVSGAPRTAFLRNPTSCPDPGVGLETTLVTDSWTHPGVFRDASFTSHDTPGYPLLPADWGGPLGTTGCANVPFDPTLVGTPAAPAKTASPSGFSFDLSLPQTDDPVVIGESDLKRAVVTLPEGVHVSASSAHGLGACSSAQVALRSDAEPSCPDSSRVGSVTIDTPLLREPLSGSVYLAVPHDNPFDSLLAIYIVAEGPGTVVKLAGHVDPDPVTGQIKTTFDDNPQLPFSRLHLEFNGGPTAPLATPRECKDYRVQSELESWSGKIVPAESTFTLSHDGKGAPCPAPHFTPDFIAGTKDPIAGRVSPLQLAFSRDDEDEELGAVTVNMPNGLTGKIKNVDLCSEDAARTGKCPDGSKVGSVTVGAGAGSDPFYIDTGRAYLTGPYKRAPYGLSIVVPAVAGPFDLGNVVVRSAIFVDRHTAELRVVSDQLPQILQGIPLDVRDVRVSVDRSNFIVNPTSCATKTIGGTLTSVDGKTAAVSSRFKVGECASLKFKPRMALSVGSVGHTARNATVPLSTTLKMPSRGQANLRSVRVTLPATINARLNVIQDACTRAEFDTDISKCAHAIAGSATAVTPLLRDPLRGNVYFVKNGHGVPDLFVALRGPVDFDLIGLVTIVHNRLLSTTFDAVPDVPVSSFTLKLLGGSTTASIGALTNLCSAKGRRAKAQLDYIAQNGRVEQVDQKLTIHGCGKQHKRGKGAVRHRGR